MKNALNTAVIGLSVVGFSVIGSAAQAANLVKNGGFSTNSLTTQSAYLGSQQETIADWDLSQIGYSFLIGDGSNATTNINLEGNGPDPNGVGLAGPGNIPVSFYSAGQTVNSADGSGWFLASDGAYGPASPTAAISQQLTGLTAGKNYTVSFFQASAQQQGFNGDVTAGWNVSFGGNSQLSTVMNHASQAPVSAWQKQTLEFTADSSTQLLSFLATGSPVGQPPFSLLSGISVEETPPPTAVPTPALLPGLLGFGMTILRKRKGNSAE